MEKPNNRMGRPKKRHDAAEVIEAATVPVKIRCNRCGREEKPVKGRRLPDGTPLHRCTGCGEWLTFSGGAAR